MAPWLPLGIGMKSLDPMSDPTLVQRVLSSSWCTTMPGLMWREYASSSWRMEELIPLNGPTFAWPKSNRTPLGHCFSPSEAARLHLNLSMSSVMHWSRSGRKYPRTQPVVSLGACPGVVRHAYKHMGTIQTTEYHFELLQWNFSKMD